MPRYALIFSVLAALLPMGLATADTLVLAGGELLTGRLIELGDGILTFKTALAGQMLVPVDEVKSLSTDASYLVSLESGQAIPGRFAMRAGAFHLVSVRGEREVEIDLATVKEILPIPPTPASPRENALKLTDLDWRLGMHWRWGEADYGAPYFKMRLMRDGGGGFQSRLFIEGADGDEFPGFAHGSLDWRWGLEDMVGRRLTVELERDIQHALDLRTDVTLGLDRLVFVHELGRMEAGLGLGLNLDFYDEDDALDSGQSGDGVFRREQARSEDIELRLQFSYERTLPWQGKLEEELVVYPSLTEWGNLRARSESSVSFPINPRLELDFDLRVDYEHEPAFDDLDEWRTSLGAGVSWRY